MKRGSHVLFPEAEQAGMGGLRFMAHSSAPNRSICSGPLCVFLRRFLDDPPATERIVPSATLVRSVSPLVTSLIERTSDPSVLVVYE